MVHCIFYRSLEEPPGIPAFSGRHKQSSSVQALSSAMAEVAKSFVPKPQRPLPTSDTDIPGSSSTVSPGKIANLRASYLQQLKDLHGLYDCGALNESEFLEQKKPILEQLTKLKP